MTRTAHTLRASMPRPDAPRDLPWWRERTRGQWAAFLAAYAGWVLDAFDFTIYFLVMPDIMREFGVSRTAAAGSITLTLVLRLLGGVTAGWAADRYGRKLPLMLSLLWFALFDGLVATAPTFTWVLVLRTLFGFGMGAEWAAGATLAMESWPQRSRGIASGILQGGWAVGYLLAAAVAAVVVPLWGWRALFLIAAVPALLVLPIRFLVPESHAPRPPRTLPEVAAPGEVPLTGRLLWATLVMGAGFAAYYGLTSLYPTLLEGTLGLAKSQVSRLVMLFNLGMLVGTVVTGALAARRDPVSAIVWPALAFLPFLPLYVGAAEGWLWLGALAAGLLGVGFAGVTPLLLTQLFPAHIRGRCVGLAYQAGACLAALAPPALAVLTDRSGLSLPHAIALVGGGSLLVLVGLVVLRPRGLLPGPERRPLAEELA
jgi:SHS family lactate transporter-like MFS transporter